MQSARRAHGDDGVVIVLVALLLIFFLITTAIVVDLGNARQQKRQAVAAADAGALAGAEALAAGTHPPANASPALSCPDVKCTAAYYTLASVDLTPNMASFTSSACIPAVTGCVQYSSGKATVKVTNPYAFGNSTPSTNVNVNVCWNANTSFAQVIGVSTINVCGSATAQSTGASNGNSEIVNDCATEDNFADSQDNAMIGVFTPGDYPNENDPDPNHLINFVTKGHATAKANQDLVVLFDGHGSSVLDLNSIDFEAPTTATGQLAVGNTVKLNRVIPQDNKGPESANAHGIGYVVQNLDATGRIQPYTAANPTFKWLISYQLPDDSHLKVGGKSWTYTATLHAASTVNPTTRCGNASWTFTHDGKNISTTNTTCGENSFFAFPPEPGEGALVTANETLNVYYVDESLLQDADAHLVNAVGKVPNATFGIDFSYTNIATGAFTQVGPQPADPLGYTITYKSDAAHSKDKFNSTISWVVPSTLNGKYTITMKAYDTDNNSSGHDCGVVSWKVDVQGGTVRLVE